jgi:hypothetical protein
MLTPGVDAAPAALNVLAALHVFPFASEPAPNVFALAVTAALPLNVVPEAAPELLLLRVSAFATLPALPLVF